MGGAPTLRHVEVEPVGFVQQGGDASRPAWVKGLDMRATVARRQSRRQRIDDRPSFAVSTFCIYRPGIQIVNGLLR